MRIHRHITLLLITITVTGAVAPVAGAFDASDPGGPGSAHHVAMNRDPVSARFVPEHVWQEINDAMVTKLLNRP
jgi:hypothetical protein